ncbi:hypothetical protein J41TS12_37130 [Paenibacillus antibioticophila]|uniref:DUF3221 domain-containing protein n=1 Tax=Paenibacillus antibioticophila TaxID=1274374 RepID=A0A919XTF6_9BACL|nr:hypothetical protein [Paenibacillus antibioticophila]GIO38852.1 hypothetical protein J41TS12_37130 [Paenibacillus antibioticophila]
MELAPRLIYRFAIPSVVFLLIVVLFILPLGRSAYNSFFGDKVTVEYKATVVSIDGDRATIEWNEDKMVVPTQGDTYVAQNQVIDLNNYKNVKIGDTFTVAVTEPGLLKKSVAEEQRTVEVKKHNINFFKSTWRKLFG